MNQQTTTRAKSLAQLQADIAKFESLLGTAQRAHKAARAALLEHREAGNDTAAGASRKIIASTSAEITELSDVIKSTKDKIAQLLERERVAAIDAAERQLRKALDALVRDATLCDEMIAGFIETRQRLRESLRVAEAEINRCGMTQDPYTMLAPRIEGIFDIAVWAVSNGEFGKARTIETPSQVREAGRASLARAATDYRHITLRRARCTLASSPVPPPEAA